MIASSIEKIVLYDEGASEYLDLDLIAGYLVQKLGTVPVEIRDTAPLFPPEKIGDYAKKLALIKVLDVLEEDSFAQEALYGEIQYEQRRLQKKTKAFGVIYDGLQLRKIFLELIAKQERSAKFVHIFFTNRLFATWQDGDRRYHARASIYGFPSIISTTGIVEAPAKPREYYLLKQQYAAFQKDLLELNDKFKGQFIDYDDKRLNDVVKGYVMQAIFYSITGHPFCDNKSCRLYNAHWQQDMIFAQLDSEYEFCERHTEVLGRLHK